MLCSRVSSLHEDAGGSFVIEPEPVYLTLLNVPDECTMVELGLPCFQERSFRRRSSSRPPLHPSAQLCSLPEVEMNIDLRYDFAFLGAAAEQVGKRLACHSISKLMDASVGQTKRFSILCEVPEQHCPCRSESEQIVPRKARVQCRCITRFMDEVPCFTNAMDAFNAATFFVVHLNSEGQVKDPYVQNGGGQMRLLKTMAVQYFREPAEHLACCNSLLVVMDTSEGHHSLPPEVEAFRSQYKLELIVKCLEPSGEGFFQLAEKTAVRIPFLASEKERALTERRLGLKERSKLRGVVRAMLQSAGGRISNLAAPRTKEGVSLPRSTCSTRASSRGSCSPSSDMSVSPQASLSSQSSSR